MANGDPTGFVESGEGNSILTLGRRRACDVRCCLRGGEATALSPCHCEVSGALGVAVMNGSPWTPGRVCFFLGSWGSEPRGPRWLSTWTSVLGV